VKNLGDLLSFFCILFWRATVRWPPLCLCRPIFLFLRDVWIRTKTAAVASRRATNLATNLPNLSTHLLNFAIHLPQLSHPSPNNLATQLFGSIILYRYRPILWIRIILMRIRILLITLMRIRNLILLVTDADADPTFPCDADPDPSFQIKAQNYTYSSMKGFR
jgi:hypothetical protein